MITLSNLWHLDLGDHNSVRCLRTFHAGQLYQIFRTMSPVHEKIVSNCNVLQHSLNLGWKPRHLSLSSAFFYVHDWETYSLDKAMYSSLGFEKFRIVPCFLGKKNSKQGGTGCFLVAEGSTLCYPIFNFIGYC